MDELPVLADGHRNKPNADQAGNDPPQHGAVGPCDVHCLPGHVAALRLAPDLSVVLFAPTGGCDPKWNTCLIAGGVELAEEVGVQVILAAAWAGKFGRAEVARSHANPLFWAPQPGQVAS